MFKKIAITNCMVDMDRMKECLIWVDRIMPEIKNTIDWSTYIYRTAVYCRFAYGFIDWRWIYGHNVS